MRCPLIFWHRCLEVIAPDELHIPGVHQNVSLLVDICRQSIYFSSVGDLRACLNAISEDCEVVPVRLKNRIDPAFSSDASAGYRNLAINLRIVTEQTLALGVETHVCEVQLMLIDMTVIKVGAYNTLSLIQSIFLAL